MRKTGVLTLMSAALLASFSLGAQGAQISGPAKTSVAGIAAPTLSIQNAFRSIVGKQTWAANTKQEVLTAFTKLPSGMQTAVTAALEPSVARNLGLSTSKTIQAIRGPRVTLQLPYISDVWPASGDSCPNSWVLIYGIGMNSNCQAWFNGAARTTYYMPWGADWGECIGFQIPSGTAIAHDYDLYVKDTAANRSGNHRNYRVVAPRSWRGNHGWKFANFGEPSPPGIPWEAFRHYFGANEVEDGSGNHLPAAQAWYDSTYRRVGAGGNCFGMTLSAERTLFWQPWSLYESWWNANHLARAWDYNFVEPQVHRSINEHQAAQLEASIMANKLYLLNNQDHNEAWERCRNLIGQISSTDNPLLSIYGPGWGHCVWPYRTEESGNTRRIYIYDNNVPYSESETSDSTMVVTINKTTGSVTWGSANRIICRSYKDCTPADPHLPSEATDGDAAMMATIVVERPARATQIVGDSGRTFYTNSQINTNPATRILNSMLFVPDTGTTRDPNFPLVYVFGNARNKTLELQLAGMRGRTVRTFTPRLVLELTTPPTGADTGNMTLNKLLTDQVSLLSAQDGPRQVRVIMRTGARQQRVVNLDIQQAGRGLLITPRADRSGVNVENRTGSELRYNLEIQNFQAGAVQTLRVPTQTLAAQTGALLTPTDWSRLADVRMELRNLQTGAGIRTEILRPGR